ncbi:MAG: MFS transporter, partial [Angustibacter sp.]
MSRRHHTCDDADMVALTHPPARSRAHAHRRAVAVLIAAQVLGGLGLAAGVSVGSILAAQILGDSALAGVPTALFTVGSALAAWWVGWWCNRAGRRPGLSLGYLAGGIGGAGVVFGSIITNVPVLLVSMLLYGAGTATNLQSRYAGADLAPPHRRGLSVSAVLFATTLGAVAGPNLAPPMGSLAEELGWPALSGPFALASLAYLAASVVLWVGLRPDPLLLARDWAAADRAEALDSTTFTPSEHSPSKRPPQATRALRAAGLTMVVTQLVMVGVMTMTPIHLLDHGHGLSAVGLVIGAHIAGMYLPSPITGWLSDRFGRRPIMIAGGVVL